MDENALIRLSRLTDVNNRLSALGLNYATVNASVPRKSDRIMPGTPMNARGLMEAATNIPVAGDALSGGMAVYDAAHGNYGSALMNALGVLPFVPSFGGMIKTKYGRIPETGAEIKSLADMLDRSGMKAGHEVNVSTSGVSPSTYLTFSRDGVPTQQVRLSNHKDVYPEMAPTGDGAGRFSVDPNSGNTFEEAVNWLSDKGFATPLAKRYDGFRGIHEAESKAHEANALQRKIDAWRNKPKATRGPMPTE